MQNNDNIILKEIYNIKILEKLNHYSKMFKVIGAKGRNIIIGDIELGEFGIQKKLLILSSLSDWRVYISQTKF